MKLFIKNMVCNRCILVVRQLLDKLGIPVQTISLGEVELPGQLTATQQQVLKAELQEVGFELLDDRRQQLMEKVKNLVIEKIHKPTGDSNKINFSTFLQEHLAIDYNYLSTLFSQTEGITIEQFVILQRIERAKELLVYNELTLSEIAYQLGYSSVQHLSSQFKKVTGLTPSHFKLLSDKKRRPLDEIA